MERYRPLSSGCGSEWVEVMTRLDASFHIGSDDGVCIGAGAADPNPIVVEGVYLKGEGDKKKASFWRES